MKRAQAAAVTDRVGARIVRLEQRVARLTRDVGRLTDLVNRVAREQPGRPVSHGSTGGVSNALPAYLTSQQACDFLGYTGEWRLRSLYRFIDANGVPKHYRSPRRFLIKRVDLESVLRHGGRRHG